MQNELVEYVRTQLVAGYSEAQLRAALHEAGHGEETIDALFARPSSPQAPTLPSEPNVGMPKKSMRPWIIAMAGACLFIILVTMGIMTTK